MRNNHTNQNANKNLIIFLKRQAPLILKMNQEINIALLVLYV